MWDIGREWRIKMLQKIFVSILLIVGVFFAVLVKQVIYSQIELNNLIEEHQESLPPIEKAIARRSIEELKEALRNTKTLNVEDFESATYFEDAIDKNWSDGVAMLLENGMNPNVNALTGEPMLLYALRKPDHEIVRMFISSGVNTDILEEEYGHLLFYAIGNELDYLLEACLNQGVDPNIQDEEGYTPLVRAVAKGNIDYVKLLIAHGANPNIGTDLPYEGSREYTAIDCAVENNKLNILKYLLENGAKQITTDDVYWLVENKAPETLSEAQQYILSQLER